MPHAAPAAAAAAGAANGQNGQQQQQRGGGMIGGIFRAIMMWCVCLRRTGRSRAARLPRTLPAALLHCGAVGLPGGCPSVHSAPAAFMPCPPTDHCRRPTPHPHHAAISCRYMMKQFMGGGKQGGGGQGGSAPMLSPRLNKLAPLDVHVYITEGRSWRSAAGSGEPVWTVSDAALAGPGSHDFAYLYHPSKVSAAGGSAGAAGGWDVGECARSATMHWGTASQPASLPDMQPPPPPHPPPPAAAACNATSLCAPASPLSLSRHAPRCAPMLCCGPTLQVVQSNGSVWVHAIFTPPGASPNPADDFFDKSATFARSLQLNAYLPKPKVSSTRRPPLHAACSSTPTRSNQR